MSLFRESFWGHAGFEDLKKHVRQGSDFCKEVALIIHERAEVESTYAKGLSKIGIRLAKATSNLTGTMIAGWKVVGTIMEQEAELHKTFATALYEDISKPMKQLVEAQHKARKPVEATVDKAYKAVADKRADEYKAKKNCYSTAKDYEKMEETLSSGVKGKDKDLSKLEGKVKKLADGLRKADQEYCELSEKAEVARQEWDFSISKACAQFQTLEEERIAKMSDYLNQYNGHISVLGPRITQSCDKLHEAILSVDMNGDIKTVAQQRGTSSNVLEQFLIDCYAEDKQFTMKTDHRKSTLQQYLLHLRQSIEREKKGREGVEKLLEVYKERPNFADKDAQEDTRQRILQVTLMMNFLEANHFKIASSLTEFDGSQKPNHKFSQYMETSRDKQGIPVTVMKVPMNLVSQYNTGYDVTSVTLGALTSDEPFDDDDFDDFTNDNTTQVHRVIGKCRAIYDYVGNAFDELSIKTGETVLLYEKLPDGWWKGEIHGKVGVFPATYVQEL
ncbi:hypothetical protein ACJMK2_023203 [Sinanodonta woodiana]|uniref:Nostrin n=1 Tax=Sinanodonta woodiana TaxID=1069815 RepID=A0ABD3T3H4_SINWO